ncbi:MAG: winged helix-turn-helix transcriptional regulator [Lewinellaceae bacterium]|nr:winged helix-turn-helix transcriptional regulator [Lewinellaceae bacterium]
MAKNTRTNTCVRTCRDESQIERCQKRLKVAANQLNILAGNMSLAGNDVRLKILLLLQEEKRLCVCDLAEILDMTVPAVSQHLKKLREGGFTLTQQEGVTVYNTLAPKAVPFLNAFFQLIDLPNLVADKHGLRV